MKKLIALIVVLAFLLVGCDFAPNTSHDGIGDGTSNSQGNNTGNNDSDGNPDDDNTGSNNSTGNNGNNNNDNNNDNNNNNNDNNNGNNGNTNNGECVTHTDTDDNGLCDSCNISVIVWFDFYGINDLHGKVLESDSQPGIDELTTFLKNAYNTNDNVILLSSGDMWQGTSESNLTNGLIITDWMNNLGFASMTLGNHEFDWGDEYIYVNAELAEFPILAINIYDKNTNQPMPYCTPSVVIEMDGIQIGIIGAIGDCHSSISGEVVGDVYFKVDDELTELVKDEADRLRSEGVDFIVYSIHDGYGNSSSSKKYVNDSDISNYYDIELSDGYVDLVFEGHTHQSYILQDSKGVIHMQGGGDNKGISHVKVRVNSANNNTLVTSPEIVKSSAYAVYSPDSLIDELLEKYDDMISKAYDVIGTNGRYRNSTYIKNLVAQLYYEAGMEMWGDEYDIVLGGGFISVRSPYNLEAGEVTYSDIYSLLPFDNQLVLCSISGYDLYYKFFATDNTNYYIYYGDYGESVLNNINYRATYYIVVDTYCSTYSYNNLTEVDRYFENVYARDLVADYVKKGYLE